MNNEDKKSNLTVRSNVYTRTKDAYFGPGNTPYFVSEKDKEYVRQIRGEKALKDSSNLVDND